VTEGAFPYILLCSDGSYYIGTTRIALEIRIAQHNAGTLGGYTATRRPMTLVYSQWFDRIADAIENERKLKKWSRAKKEAFIRGDLERCGNSRREDYPIRVHRTRWIDSAIGDGSKMPLELTDHWVSHGYQNSSSSISKIR
jgi:putative endonuclease